MIARVFRLGLAACCLFVGFGCLLAWIAVRASEPPRPQTVQNVAFVDDERAAEPTPGLDQVRQALDAQMQQLEEQARLIDEQRRQLEAQRQQLQAQQQQLEMLERAVAVPGALALDQIRGAGVSSTSIASRGAVTPPSDGRQVAQASQPAQAGSGDGGEGTPTGDESETPLADLLEDFGRVLTRKGTLVVEPQVQYAHNTANQFFYNGVEIIPGIQIGVIEISENERNTLTNSLSFRYGVTNRFEADLKIPYVVNKQESQSRVLSGADPNTISGSSVRNSGLGDVEFGGHFQFNRGLDGWPFFVGNLRVKSRTGEGSFDVDQQREAVTGSGFWAIEPSATVIYPTDPAVLFANVGYTVNLERDVNSVQGNTLFTNVNPGDVLRTNFGIGFGLNERLSLNLGYKHDWVRGAVLHQRLADDPDAPIVETKTNDFQVGSLQFGLSYKVTEKIPVIVNVAAGVTSEAPDAEVGIRVPIPFDIFE